MRWCGDRLYDVFGFSDETLAAYCVELAKSSPNEISLMRELIAKGAPNTPGTREFAHELLQRIRPPTPEPVKEYGLLLSDEETEEERRLRKKKAKKKRKKEEVAKTSETAHEKDARERDAFNSRMREKDLARTKKTANKYMQREELQGVKEEDVYDMFPELRESSRQEYVKKRLKQRMLLLAKEISDEEQTFIDLGVKLTSMELESIERKKTLLRIASEMVKEMKADDGGSVGYQIPMYREGSDGVTGDVEAKLKAFEETKRKRQQDSVKDGITDQEVWEQAQIDKALMRFGGGAEKLEENKYEFLVEDQIKFVKHEILAGENFEKADPAAEAVDNNDLDAVRKSLPIYSKRPELMQAIADNQILIIVGQTGSGKTTQVPQYLLEDGYCSGGKKVGCTQPRRVAAMSVAARVACEMKCKLGREVGYSIRFEDKTGPSTVVKYMTDGMLLREFLSEPDLGDYSVMMVDEAHERSLHTDILLGLLKDLCRLRPDFKLLISSATVNAAKFSAFFDDAPIYHIPGRRFNVDILYTAAPEANYLDAVIVTVLQIHLTQDEGDVLVFLTGQEEIEFCAENLEERMRKLGSRANEMIICPVYANLPSDLQSKIFETTPVGARKVVLATNIAETSLTIDGIKFVIDPGFCKQNSYNPRTGLESLLVTPVSRASAEQRAGRAGRTAPGVCQRLYTVNAYHQEMEDEMVPEIQRTNLANVVLLLLSMNLGVDGIINFDFMDPPPAEMLVKALELLFALGALNDIGQLTKLGRMMAEIPADPMLSKMLIQSQSYGVSEEILTIASMLGVNASIFYRPKDKKLHADKAHKNFWSIHGDHLTLLNVYNQWVETDYSVDWCYENFVQIRALTRARDIRDQLEALMERVEVELISNAGDHVAIRKSIASGFFYHMGRLDKAGNYKTIKHNQSVSIHPSSCLFEALPRWVVYHELVLTSKEFMRCTSEILPEWMLEIAPHYYKKKELEDNSNKKLPKRRE